jgi:hypothetical protein
LNDPLGLTVEDDSSEGESRWITLGMNAGGARTIPNISTCFDCSRIQ